MFAGIGGICLGFKYAHANIVWANEQDKYACRTYRHVFGSGYLTEGDICKIDTGTIPDMDVLTAGFPCQPFSIMGKQKGFADTRGTMYFQILRIIDAKQPRIVLLENVKNLLRHDNGNTFTTIRMTLEKRGYFLKYAVLGPNTHGNTPQYRDRIFIVAFLDYNMMERFNFPEGIPLRRTIDDVIDRSAAVDYKYYYNKTNGNYETLNSRMSDNNAIYRIDDGGIATKAWQISRAYMLFLCTSVVPAFCICATLFLFVTVNSCYRYQKIFFPTHDTAPFKCLSCFPAKRFLIDLPSGFTKITGNFRGNYLG